MFTKKTWTPTFFAPSMGVQILPQILASGQQNVDTHQRFHFSLKMFPVGVEGIIVGGTAFARTRSRLCSCIMVSILTRRGTQMTNLTDRITIDPEQCGGRPCIRGMRIRVVDVLDLFAAGLNSAEILEELPDLEVEDIKAALSYAARHMNHPVLVA